MSESVKERAFLFLVFALIAFMGLGLELLLAFGLEPLLFGKMLDAYSDLENVLHWSLTCVVWATIAYALLQWSQKNGLAVFNQKKRLNGFNWLGALCRHHRYQPF